MTSIIVFIILDFGLRYLDNFDYPIKINDLILGETFLFKALQQNAIEYCYFLKDKSFILKMG
jgi:hypothetical protein